MTADTPGTAQADERPVERVARGGSVDEYLNLYRAARAVWPFLEGMRLLAFDSTETDQRIMRGLASALVDARNDLFVRTTARLDEPPAVPPSDRERELEQQLEKLNTAHGRLVAEHIARGRELDKLNENRAQLIAEHIARGRELDRVRAVLAERDEQLVAAGREIEIHSTNYAALARELEQLRDEHDKQRELLELRLRIIETMKEETRERDEQLRNQSDELAAANREIARLQYAVAHYTDSTIVASWPMRALGDNGQIARAALGAGDHDAGCDWVTREQCRCGYERRVSQRLRELSSTLLSTPRRAPGTAQANETAPARPSAPAGAPAAEPPRYDFYLVRRELLEQTRVELRNRLDAHPDAVAHVLDMSRSQIAVLLGLIDLELSTPARPLLDTMRAHAAEYREKLRELDESGEAHTRPKYRTQLESRLAELDEIMRDQGAELLPFELETPSAPPQVPTIVHAERVLRRTRLEQLRDRFAGYRDQLRELDDEIKHAFERGHVNTDWMKDKHNRLSLRLSELRAVASICGYKLGDDDEQK